MGAKSSKPSQPASPKNTETTPAESLESFGETSEFWFLVEPIPLESIKSAKDFHQFVVESLPYYLKRRIIGTFLDIGGRRWKEVQGYVYCQNLVSAKDACEKMNSKSLGRRRINTALPHSDETEAKAEDTHFQSEVAQHRNRGIANTVGPVAKNDKLHHDTRPERNRCLQQHNYSSHHEVCANWPMLPKAMKVVQQENRGISNTVGPPAKYNNIGDVKFHHVTKPEKNESLISNSDRPGNQASHMKQVQQQHNYPGPEELPANWLMPPKAMKVVQQEKRGISNTVGPPSKYNNIGDVKFHHLTRPEKNESLMSNWDRRANQASYMKQVQQQHNYPGSQRASDLYDHRRQNQPKQNSSEWYSRNKSCKLDDEVFISESDTLNVGKKSLWEARSQITIEDHSHKTSNLDSSDYHTVNMFQKQDKLASINLRQDSQDNDMSNILEHSKSREGDKEGNTGAQGIMGKENVNEEQLGKTGEDSNSEDSAVAGYRIKAKGHHKLREDNEVVDGSEVRSGNEIGSDEVEGSNVIEKGNEVVGGSKVSDSNGVGGSSEVGDRHEVGGGNEVGDGHEVGGANEVGGRHEVGEDHEVGGGNEVGDSHEAGRGNEVGDGHEVGRGNEVGDGHEVGGRHEVGGGNEVGDGHNVEGGNEVGEDYELGGRNGVQIVEGNNGVDSEAAENREGSKKRRGTRRRYRKKENKEAIDCKELPANTNYSVSEDNESYANSSMFNSEVSKSTESGRKSRRSKEKFVVMLYDLPPSFDHKDLTSLFKGKYEGFKRAFLNKKQEGAAVAVFSSANEVIKCSKTLAGLSISGRKIKVRAKISTEQESEFNQASLVQLNEVGMNQKVTNWLTQNDISSPCSIENEKRDSLSDHTQDDSVSLKSYGESVISCASSLQGETVASAIVSNLPQWVSNKKLYNVFDSKCEGVKKAFRTSKPGHGKVVFINQKDMEICVEKMNGTFQFGSKNGPIYVGANVGGEKRGDQHEQQQDQQINQHQDYEQQQQQQQPELNQEQLNKKQRSRRRDRGGKKRLQQRTVSSSENSSNCYRPNSNDDISFSTPFSLPENADHSYNEFDGENQKDAKGAENPTGEISDVHEGQLETVVIRNIPKNVTKNCFLQFVESTNCKGIVKLAKSKNRQVAVLSFSTESQAKLALQVLNGFQWRGAKLEAKKGRSASENTQTKNEPQEEITDQAKNPTVRIYNVPPSSSKADLENFITRQCPEVKILRLVKAEGKYIVELTSEEQCREVKESLAGKTFDGRRIRTTMSSRSKAKTEEKPYAVVSNINKNFGEKAVKTIFEKYCQGVLEVEKIAHFFRVYFKSADLAKKAVQVMSSGNLGGKDFVQRGKKLTVKLGHSASKEIERKELGGQLERYTADLESKRNLLLDRNNNQMKEFEKRLEKFAETHSGKKEWISLDESERSEEEKKAYGQKLRELRGQREEFERKYKELMDCFSFEAEDRRHVDQSGVKEVIDKHSKVMKREIKRFEASLPIYAKRNEILEMVRQSQVLVLIGETGSGKSTQLAQYLADEQLGGTIVVTQPRKIAAVSLAKRVAEEYGCSVGEQVGYHVGLRQKVSGKTVIKFVTDRILLNEVLKDKDGESIGRYSCIVIDEAHERSIYTDLLLAMIKRNLSKHPNLKLIVTSATLNTEVFRKYFDDCPILQVQGRTFPVERIYERVNTDDYTNNVVEKTVEVCQSGEEGDILVFLTQQNEIEKTCEQLEKRLGKNNIILPLHGKLQAEEQELVFKPTPKGKRKIVIATNAAETSITVDGIRIVIDSGMVKEPSFDPSRNMTTLEVKMVSRSSALQRSGRAGRTAPGKCYCMYTMEDFNQMEKDTKPEILKMHLGMAVLQLLKLGVAEVERFDFVEAPPREALVTAKDSLKQLGAIDQDETLTELGERMLELPTDPKLSKAVLEGLRRGCGEEIITVAGLMSSGRDVFYRGDTAEKKDACAIQKQEFCKTSGDLLSALEVYKQWLKQPPDKQKKWCMENALNAKTLRATSETIKEIKYALTKLGLGKNHGFEVSTDNLEQALCKSLLAGYFENIAWSRGHEKVGYTVLLSNQNARLHPSSVLSSLGSQPQWILFQEMRRTSETFLVNITPIEMEWLADVAMHMLQYIDEDEINRSQAIRETIRVGPALVKSVIGSRGSTLKGIEKSVVEYKPEYYFYPDEGAAAPQQVFCSIECNVEKGLVEIYAPSDRLEYAKSEVEMVIEDKRRDILHGCTEMVISKVGSLKAMVGNDMNTRLILQPNEFCKFDVFIKKEDETYKVDDEDVLETLKDAGEVVHYNFSQSLNNSNRWGNVTYSSPEVAKAAKILVESGFDETDLPFNVQQIKLKPCRVEHLEPQNSVSAAGVRVLVSWYPFPSTGKAYIKCKTSDAAQELLSSLNQTRKTDVFGFRASLNKKTGDIALPVGLAEDICTVQKKIDASGFSQVEAISKITVPSRRGDKEVNVEEEKRNVQQLMKESGHKVHLLNCWVGNCQKVTARVIFLNIEDAEKAIEDMNGTIDKLGARSVYLELEGKCEFFCNKRLYHKVKKTLERIVEEHEGVKLEEQDQRGRGMKITITDKDPVVVQKIGVRMADVVAVKSVIIEDPAIVRGLSAAYSRNKLKKIEKESDAFVQSSMLGRCLQITGTPEAKEKAQKRVEKLIKEVAKEKNVEIQLRGSDIPVGAIRNILKKYGRNLGGLVQKDEECQVTMDIRRRKLIARGSNTGVENVRARVESFLRELRGAHHSVNEENEVCPVCIDEVQEPYRLNLCGHSYCTPCIEQYVTSMFTTVKSADMFPLKCLYDNCEHPLTKDDFLAFLKKDEIEQLYRVSFECFLAGSNTYKPCPTPDCSWVYKSTSRPEIFSCPECSARVCRSCADAAHELYDTCEAYKASKDPSKGDELLKKWASEADTKKCPKCSVMIEKNKGCSHVHCTRCNAHICWKCGEYFDTDIKCYGHIGFCRR